jgi:hypothetical protein
MSVRAEAHRTRKDLRPSAPGDVEYGVPLCAACATICCASVMSSSTTGSATSRRRTIASVHGSASTSGT